MALTGKTSRFFSILTAFFVSASLFGTASAYTYIDAYSILKSPASSVEDVSSVFTDWSIVDRVGTGASWQMTYAPLVSRDGVSAIFMTNRPELPGTGFSDSDWIPVRSALDSAISAYRESRVAALNATADAGTCTLDFMFGMGNYSCSGDTYTIIDDSTFGIRQNGMAMHWAYPFDGTNGPSEMNALLSGIREGIPYASWNDVKAKADEISAGIITQRKADAYSVMKNSSAIMEVEQALDKQEVRVAVPSLATGFYLSTGRTKMAEYLISQQSRLSGDGRSSADWTVVGTIMTEAADALKFEYLADVNAATEAGTCSQDMFMMGVNCTGDVFPAMNDPFSGIKPNNMYWGAPMNDVATFQTVLNAIYAGRPYASFESFKASSLSAIAAASEPTLVQAYTDIKTSTDRSTISNWLQTSGPVMNVFTARNAFFAYGNSSKEAIVDYVIAHRDGRLPGTGAQTSDWTAFMALYEEAVDAREQSFVSAVNATATAGTCTATPNDPMNFPMPGMAMWTCSGDLHPLLDDGFSGIKSG